MLPQFPGGWVGKRKTNEIALCDPPQARGKPRQQPSQIKICDQRFLDFDQQTKPVAFSLKFLASFGQCGLCALTFNCDQCNSRCALDEREILFAGNSCLG